MKFNPFSPLPTRFRLTRRHFLKSMAAGGTSLLASGPFRSAWSASGSTEGSVRLVFYTDIHARTEWDTPQAMERAANAINGQGADLAIAGGDLITDGFQSSAETVAPRWDAYLAFHRRVHGDIYPVIGNHDLVAAIPEDGTQPSPDPRGIFREKLGLDSTYYAFDAVGYHFVVLDAILVTGGKLKYNGLITPEQLEWLRGDLALVSRDTPIVLVSHIPLLTAFFAATEGSTTAGPKNRVLVNNTQILDLFQDYNLILVLQGHLHVSELLRWRNTTFLTGGAICGKWWRGPWYGTEEGFCVMDLHGDHVEWNYIDYGWEARRP